MNPPYDCPECHVKPGQCHRSGCYQEVCRNCGGQLRPICPGGCSRRKQSPRVRWTGELAGFAECREFGYWCSIDDVGTPQPEPKWIGEDDVYPNVNLLLINTARGLLRWDRDRARYVKVEKAV